MEAQPGLQYEYFAKIDTDCYVRSMVLEASLRAIPAGARHPLYFGKGWSIPLHNLCRPNKGSLFFVTGQLVVLSRCT